MQLKIIGNCAAVVVILALLASCGSPPDTVPGDWEPQLAPGEPLAFKDSLSIAMFQGDIWATTWAHDILGPGLLLRYTPTTKTVITYSVQLEQGTGIPSLLLTSSKGVLWGAGMNPQTPASFLRDGCDKETLWPWFLSYYNAATDRFEAVQDSRDLLRGCEIRSFTEDKQGNLWLLVDYLRLRPRLLRFNPSTAQATLIDLSKQLDTLSLQSPNEIVGGPDGAVWMEATRKSPKSLQPQLSGRDTAQEREYPDRVLRYDPETGSLQEMGTPGRGIGGLARLYFDHHERLWTSFVSWTDFLAGHPAGWHDLGADMFITPVPTQEKLNHIAPIWQIFQSSDGLMWFASSAGLVTYDLEKNRWKRVSPTHSVIVQDEVGNMWTATMGQIYRFQPQR